MPERSKKEQSKLERELPYWILILGLALRIYAAISHLDISHPDEHFQTLEPASHIVYGFGWLSWEWSEGLRSWLIPALYVPILEVFKGFGVRGGPGPIIACRVLMALVSTATLYQFWVLLRESALKFWASGVALAIFAFSPALIAMGAMTLTDVWAVVFLWCALPFVFRAIEPDDINPSRVRWAGVLLGLSFLARIQMILFAIGLGIALLLRPLVRPLAVKRISWKTILNLAFGYTLVVLFQGVLDWATWGWPFHSVILNIQKNLFEHVAAFYGTSPVYDYFLKIPGFLGWPVLGAAVLAVAAAIGLGRAKFRERDLWVALPSLLYFGVHCAISHKETRFMFPVLPAILYFLAWGLSAFEREARVLVHRGLVIVALLIAAVVSSGFIYSTDHTYPFDLSELTLAIREDGGLSHGGCLLLVDHYWIWTRGELMIGAPIRTIEVSSTRGFPPSARDCAYAITLPGREAWFNQPGSPHWKILKKDSHGQILFKNEP